MPAGSTDSRSAETGQRLLAFLGVHGFVRTPEVAVTMSLAWLAGRRPVWDAFAVLAGAQGLVIPPTARWIAEVLAEDRTRTDLECIEADRRAPLVVVEAKIDAVLTSAQLHRYATDQLRRLQQAGERRGLLVALVPAHRRSEAHERLAEASAQLTATTADFAATELRTAVWTYDELFHRLGSVDDDVAQLKSLVATLEGLDVRPFTAADLRRPQPRHHDFEQISDRVSAAVTPVGLRLFPSGRNDPDFEWRRYVEAAPGRSFVAIGIRRGVDARTSVEQMSPLWLRVHRDTPEAGHAAERLLDAYPSAELDENGHAWVPFKIPIGVAGAEAVRDLTEQATKMIGTVLGL
jgi:hypothetical protein